ncbi:MAG: hypothetical protein RI885_2450 [Actinomycetota bacterium]|jgi:hypothetical protein
MRLGSVFFVGIGFTLAVMVFLGGYLVLVDDVPTWILYTGVVSLVFLVLLPTMLGFSVANVPSGIPRADQTAQLRTVAVAAGISFVLGLIGILVVSTATPAGSPVIVLLVIGSVVVIILSALVGLRRRRKLALSDRDIRVPLPVSRDLIIRKCLWIAITVLLGTALGTAGLAAFAIYLGDADGSQDAGSWVVFGSSVGLILGSLTCIAVSWRWVQAMRVEIGDDPDVQRSVRRAVFGRTDGRGGRSHADGGRTGDDALSDEEVVRATRWAALQSVHLPFAAAQVGLLLLGVVIQCVWNLVVGNVMGLATFTTAVLVTCATVLVIAVLVGVVRARRARHFVVGRAVLFTTQDEWAPGARITPHRRTRRDPA